MGTKFARGLLISTSLIALVALQPTFAAAQTAPVAPTATNAAAPKQGRVTLLKRLILGAGRTKVATETPQAVTVLEQEDLDEKIMDDLGDITDKIPGVKATGGDSNILGSNFNIRGFGPQEVGSNQESRVLLTVDGATKYYESYRMGGIFADPALFKRVEVLRGPASGTLYGSGVLGGVINFTTKDASDFLEEGDRGALRVKLEGDSNQKGYVASAILALRASENAEFLVSANYRDVQNIIAGGGFEKIGTAGQFPSGLLKGTFYLDEAKEQVLRASYSHTETDGLSATSPGGLPVTTPPLIPRSTADTTYVLSYEDEASDNPWLDLKINASYSEQINKQEQFINAEFSYAYWELKGENTFEWEGEGYENFLTVGLQGKYHERRRFDLDGTGIGSHPEGNQTVIGAFAQNEFVWDDKLTIIGGIRADWQSMEAVGTSLFVNGNPNLAKRAVQPVEVSDVALAPKLAVHYKLTDTLSVFGSYAYTERMPGIDEEFSFTATAVQGKLNKETAHTVELGFGQELTDVIQEGDQFSYKLTGFYNDVQNRIIRGGDALPVSTKPFVNAGETIIYGVELEGAYDTEYAFANFAASLIRGNEKLTGRPAASIAPDEISFTLGGKVPDYDVRFGWDARFVAAQSRWPEALPPFVADEQRLKAFNVHDIFASWKPQEGTLKGFELTGRVNNIFDKNYQEYLQTAGPAKGRSFKASMAYTAKF